MELIDRLTAWLHRPKDQPAPEPLPELDARLALGALLVRLAKADHVYLFEELEQIDRILAEREGLGPIDAAKMRATCERLEHAMPETEHFTALIREAVPYDERRSIVEALWRVILADGIEQDQELIVAELIEDQLGVERAHSKSAREAAEVIR